ncbi:MAG: acetyl-CoA C-acyltransferase [Opitutae bacterium]|nr:acetyl-CoA C-acyltransferase [Opitutae bacterium]
MHEAYIVSAVRTPVGKAPNGKLRTVRSDDLGALVVHEALVRAPGIDPAEVEDVILGCAMPEGAQGFNIARIVAQRASLPDAVPGVTVNRFCTSGLEALAIGAQRIMSGMADVIVAGGTESMSLVPMFGHRTTFNPTLADTAPDAYLPMGLTAENVARQYGISRTDQDTFAYDSHRKALAAIGAGRFAGECVAVPVREVFLDATGHRQVNESRFETDEGPRRDTTLERLATLKPAFHPRGTVTAGNSSQRSDGAAALLLVSGQRLKALGLKPLARFISYAVGGVAPGVMGMGPTVSIPKVLKRAGLTVADLDLIELNEAFAAQALAVIRECGLPPEKVNVNGGAIALGHPLGATGAKLTVSLLTELRRRGGRYGLITLCVGGGWAAQASLKHLTDE